MVRQHNDMRVIGPLIVFPILPHGRTPQIAMLIAMLFPEDSRLRINLTRQSTSVISYIELIYR